MKVYGVYASGQLIKLKSNKKASYECLKAMLPADNIDDLVSYCQFTRLWKFKGSFQFLTSLGQIINIKLLEVEKK